MLKNLSPKGQRRLKTTCKNGHPRSDSRTAPNGYLVCRACERDRRNSYYKKYPERNKIRALDDRRLRLKKRTAIIEFLGGKCKVCGFDDQRALQIDHVNGGGTRETQEVPYVGARYNLIRSYPENYQLLCANHNAIKVWENEERVTKY